MKSPFLTPLLLLLLTSLVMAGVSIDEAKFGASLGGWKMKGNKTAQYHLSGAEYRTYRPEVTPTPDEGIFISIRIDHVRGWLSSNDHAVLEVTVDRDGNIASAQSNIAIQGRSVSSDLIRGVALGGKQAVGMDRAVAIGTELVADISSKMLREKIVEAGRVSFPSVLRHNYNLLYQAIRTTPRPPVAIQIPEPGEEPSPEQVPSVPPAESKGGKEKNLQIRPYGVVEKSDM